MKKFLALQGLLLAIIGYTLLVIFAGWQVAIAVFCVQYSNNIDEGFRKARIFHKSAFKDKDYRKWSDMQARDE